MKSILTPMVVFVCAMPAFAQGLLTFNNGVAGNCLAPVYNVDPAHPSESKTGNTATGFPVGTTTYAGAGLGGTAATGPNYTAQLFIGPTNASDDQLTALWPSTSFRTTTAAAGRVIAVPISTAPLGTQKIQLRAWDNLGGTVTNWYDAVGNPSVPFGWSPSFTITPGDATATPPGASADLIGLQSFQLFIPEPVFPWLFAQPVSQTAWVGGTATFSVSVRETQPVFYQWYFNDVLLDSATNSELILTNVQPAYAGDYYAVVSSALHGATSRVARLSVKCVDVFVNEQPLTEEPATFLVSASVRLESGFAGGVIFYTLDGSPPSLNSAIYSGPFTVSRSVNLRLLAFSANFDQSCEEQVFIRKLRTWSLSATTAGGGTVAVNPPNGPYPDASSVSLTATPATGWRFLHWLGSVNETNPTATLNMYANRCVQAVFGTTLGTTVAGNGFLVLNPPGGVYPYGTVVRITAEPQPGNYFGLWGNAASGRDNPLDFIVTSPTQIISCVFGALPADRYTLTVLEDGLGRVSTSPQTNLYTSGQMVTVTATPNPDQVFLGWSGDASGNENPLSVTMIQSKVITANFSRWARLTPPACPGQVAEEGYWFTLTGEAGKGYVIEASTNLPPAPALWTPLLTLTNEFGTMEFFDPGATNYLRRFYRTVLLP